MVPLQAERLRHSAEILRNEFSRAPSALRWVRFVLSAASFPLTGAEIFRCIRAEVEREYFLTHEEAFPRWDHSHWVFGDAIRWGCRHGDIIAKARRFGSDSGFEAVSAEQWAYLEIQMADHDWIEKVLNVFARDGVVHNPVQPGALVPPTGILVGKDSGLKVREALREIDDLEARRAIGPVERSGPGRSRDQPRWEMAVYSLAPQGAQNAAEVSHPSRDDTTALIDAIEAVTDELGQPGRDVQWKPWCDRLRGKIGVQPTRRGFSDKSIRRAVKRLEGSPERHSGQIGHLGQSRLS